MRTLRDIASDPHKALKELENELGAQPGDLLREMEAADKGDWKQHLPYQVAQSFYEDEFARKQYEMHVDACDYCKSLLQTLHPSDLDVRRFAVRAAAFERPALQNGGRWYTSGYAVPIAVPISVAMTTAALFALQSFSILPSPVPHYASVINELRIQPSKLSALENSNNPSERFKAAQYYFAFEQPQLAYRQIGQGLELAGLPQSDTRRITTAADIPADSSAASILAIAAGVATSKAAVAEREPGVYLDRAVAQAKLGLHRDSLESIIEYLEARKADPKVIQALSALPGGISSPGVGGTLRAMKKYEPSYAVTKGTQKMNTGAN